LLYFNQVKEETHYYISTKSLIVEATKMHACRMEDNSSMTLGAYH
jgi:hypothetical protein